MFPLLLCNIRTALAPQGPYTRAITFVANDYHVTAPAAERTVIAILLLLLKKNIAMLLLLKKNIAMLLLLKER